MKSINKILMKAKLKNYKQYKKRQQIVLAFQEKKWRSFGLLELGIWVEH